MSLIRHCRSRTVYSKIIRFYSEKKNFRDVPNSRVISNTGRVIKSGFRVECKKYFKGQRGSGCYAVGQRVTKSVL